MIFYFSATGNSLYAAKKAAQILCEQTTDMAESLKSGNLSFEIGENERVGFVFPVYYGGLPSVVGEFIDAFKISGCSDAFALLTCGGSAMGAGALLRDRLGARGISLSYCAEIKMPDNYIVMFTVEPREKLEKLNGDAEKKTEKCAQEISRGVKALPGATAAKRGISRIMQAMYGAMRNTKKFTSHGCVSCSLCESICPVGAIKITDGAPVWVKSKCSHCMACINRCPVSAIEYGRKTLKSGRYVHPVLGGAQDPN